jgi:hypothetical protein
MGIGFQASINSKSILAKEESDGLNSTFVDFICFYRKFIWGS